MRWTEQRAVGDGKNLMVGIYKKQYAEPYPYHAHGGYRTTITAGGGQVVTHRLFPSFLGKDGGVPPGR